MKRLPISPVWLVLGSIASVQFGASFAKTLFGAVAPVSVTWLRLTAGALILLVVARPRLRGRTRDDWLLLAVFAVCLVTMNTVFYYALPRIPIGVAVTIEFLGPLTVAVLGSRKLLDFLWVGLAGLGVALLGLSPGRIDWWGVLLALLAGACWGGYIILGARMPRTSWRSIDTLALSCAAGSLALAPFALSADAGGGLQQPRVLLVGALVGLLCSVLPYTLELTALQHMQRHVFSILMSLEPAVAAFAAFLVLGEKLGPVQLAAMACVIIASVGSTQTERRRAVTRD